MTTTDMPNKVHEGRNVKRFREMLGIKQEALALDLGGDWNQKKVSILEQKETIEPEILEQVAKLFKVTPEAIKSFNEASAINIISSTLNDNAGSVNNNCSLTFNPIEKIVELYERLLASEKEKNELLKAKDL